MFVFCAEWNYEINWYSKWVWSVHIFSSIFNLRLLQIQNVHLHFHFTNDINNAYCNIKKPELVSFSLPILYFGVICICIWLFASDAERPAAWKVAEKRIVTGTGNLRWFRLYLTKMRSFKSNKLLIIQRRIN